MKSRKNTKKKIDSGVEIRSGLKGGRLSANHTRAGLKVASGVKGGKLSANHTRAALKVLSREKAPRTTPGNSLVGPAF